MPSITNPNFVDPITTWANANKAAVSSWLAAAPQATMRTITFDYIRQNAAGMAGKSDGELAALAAACNLQVNP